MNLMDVESMAIALMIDHKLREPGNFWHFRFDNAKRRAGRCTYGKRMISLSAPLSLIYPEDQIRDTILHEIAHAIAGAHAGHGRKWQKVALSIGCSGERCVDESAPTVEGPWKAVCVNGHALTRFRRPMAVSTCSLCSNKFDLAYVLEWTYKGETVEMSDKYIRSLNRALIHADKVTVHGETVFAARKVKTGFDSIKWED